MKCSYFDNIHLLWTKRQDVTVYDSKILPLPNFQIYLFSFVNVWTTANTLEQLISVHEIP